MAEDFCQEITAKTYFLCSKILGSGGDTVNGTRWNLCGKSVRSQTYTMNIISDNV